MLTLCPGDGAPALAALGRLVHEQCTAYYSSEAQRRLGVHSQRVGSPPLVDTQLRVAFKVNAGCPTWFQGTVGNKAPCLKMYMQSMKWTSVRMVPILLDTQLLVPFKLRCPSQGGCSARRALVIPTRTPPRTRDPPSPSPPVSLPGRSWACWQSSEPTGPLRCTCTQRHTTTCPRWVEGRVGKCWGKGGGWAVAVHMYSEANNYVPQVGGGLGGWTGDREVDVRGGWVSRVRIRPPRCICAGRHIKLCTRCGWVESAVGCVQAVMHNNHGYVHPSASCARIVHHCRCLPRAAPPRCSALPSCGRWQSLCMSRWAGSCPCSFLLFSFFQWARQYEPAAGRCWCLVLACLSR